jgi:asparagine synthase (glutamine-hydrolysing)
MAHSIEARVPFLDYRLVEMAFRMPDELKIHHAETKVALRQAMRGILPEAVRQRRDKMGFVTPEREWLAGELSTWVSEIIHSPSFQQRPYFNAPEIQKSYGAYTRGQVDLTGLAWRWVNLELWLRQMVEQK